MPASPPEFAISPLSVLRVDGSRASTELDAIATEEPLEIQLGYTRAGQRIRKTIALTMRTPGHDRDLAAGFLFTEGILRDPDDIESITDSTSDNSSATILITLRDHALADIDLRALDRHGPVTSACGLCGKTSLESLRTSTRHPLPPASHSPTLSASAIHRLPALLRSAQAGFDQTGGLHAAALFTFDGELIAIREDVGRHNAVDKLIGSQFLANRLPLSDQILLVSSRASFELVQKLLMAGGPALAAVGAPTSLAIALAREAGATLLGFVRDNRFNVYAGASRLRDLPLAATVTA